MTLKATGEYLQKKINEAAKTVAAMISTVKFIAEHFAGRIAERILDAAARCGNGWLQSNGYPECSRIAADLPRSITKEMELDLKYVPGKKELRTYDGTKIAKVDSMKEARERFPGCSIKMQDYELSR